MGKYDCTKAKDFLHEAARVRRECLANTSTGVCDESCPLMAKLFGKESYRCISHSTIADEMFLKIPDNEFQEIVKRMQQWSDEHPKRRELTPDEVTILNALCILKFKYIAKDKCGKVYAYLSKPNKHNEIWSLSQAQSCVVTDEGFDEILSFDDEEPALIKDLLHNT